MRAVSLLLRAALVLIPLLILGAWSLTYLRGVFRLLGAPGVPLELRLKTPGGAVTARVDAYAVDLGSGRGWVSGASVRDPSGVLIARVGRAEARGLDALRGEDQIVLARIQDVFLRVRRDRGGFDFQRYLPKSDGRPGTVPYDVEILRARAVYADAEYGRFDAYAPRLRVAGLGDDTTAAGVVRVGGFGTLPLSVRRIREGVAVDAVLARTEVGGLVRRLGGRAVGRLRWSSLTVAGPVRVFVPAGGKVAAEVRLTATGTGLVYDRYRVDAARFAGLVSPRGATGTLDARVGTNRLRFEGAGLVEGREVAGRALVTSPSREALPGWAAAFVPPAVRWRSGQAAGWVAYRGGEPSFQGRVRATTVAYGPETVRDANVILRADPRRVLARVERIEVRGVALRGAGTLDVRSRTIVAGARTLVAGDLGRLASGFGVRGLRGAASGAATVSGTLSDPWVRFSANGSGEYDVPGRAPVRADSFEVAGVWKRGAVAVTRGYLRSPAALATVSGDVSPTGALDLRAEVRSLRLASLDARLGGTANARARIGGTVRAPVAKGRIEGYLASFQGETLPVVTADFSADRRAVRLANLYALRGTGVLRGGASLALATRRISGALQAEDLETGDFTDGQTIGTVDVPRLLISGTLDAPRLDGVATAETLVVRGIKVEGVRAELDGGGTGVRLRSLTARLLGGEATATGDFDPKTGAGLVRLTSTPLDLGPLAAELAPGATLDGTAAVEGLVRFGRSGLRDGDAEVRLRGVRLNGRLLGGGSVKANLLGRRIAFSGSLGQLSRYVTIENGDLDLDARTIAAEIAASNLRVPDLVGIGLPYAPKTLDPEARRTLNDLDGAATLAARVSGPWNSPDVVIETLTVEGIALRGDPLGTLELAGAKRGERIEVARASFTGPVGSARGRFLLAEDGTLEGELDPVRTDLAALGAFVPALAGRTGVLDATFALDGTRENPRVRGSLSVEGLFATAGAAEDRGLRFSLDDLRADRTDGLQASGSFSYRGFTGAISATAGLPAPFDRPDGVRPPLRAALTLAERPLKEIAGLFDGLDPARTGGTVGGALVVDLAPGGEPRVAGQVRLRGDVAALGVDDRAEGLDLTLTLQNERIALEGRGRSSRGGTIALTALATVRDPLRLADEFGRIGPEALRAVPVRAGLTLDGVALRQAFEGRAYATGRASGEITLAGDAYRPEIGGELRLSGADTILPTFEARDASSARPAINPTLNVAFRTEEPARVRSATADLRISGGGRLTGTLSAPRANADLEVDSGSIRLPGALVRLEQGGTIDVDYRGGEVAASTQADVNLEGRTAVTTLSPAGNVQRYDVTLLVRGDLLRQNGLQLTAESDPNDLSSERILALIARTDLFENLNSGVNRSEAEGQVRDALIGFALPSLLDPITGRFAQALGFDYLGLDYNPFERASVVFGRTLGKDFSLQGRRQIEPAPGFPARFDIRLQYRPRRARGLLSRLTFSIGADEVRPIKIAVEYSVRF